MRDALAAACAAHTRWSQCDEIVNPDSSVALGRSDSYADATVYGQVRRCVR